MAINRAISLIPTPLERALRNVTALLGAPHVRTLPHGDEWAIVAEPCEWHAIAGPAVSDAWIAAGVLHHSEHLVTFDRDFRRLLPPRHLTILRS